MTYRNEVYWDEEKGELRSTIIQDVTPVLELNKAEYNLHSAGNNWKGEWHHIASIPRALVAQWMREGINVLNPDERDEKAIAMKLNDIGYRNIRTKPGRV